MGLTGLFIDGIMIDWEGISPSSYLRDIDAFSGMESIPLKTPVTFFVGENGTGKSTLLEAMAVSWGFNPEGGTVNYNFSTYDSHSELGEHVTLSRGASRPSRAYFYRAESFYNVATMEEEYRADRSGLYHHRSHGEGFLKLMDDELREGGLYLMDEPESALSPQRQLSLLADIHFTASRGAQFIIVTHSPILLGLPGADIISFDGPLEHVDYEDTEAFRVTSLFMKDRERLLHSLLRDD